MPLSTFFLTNVSVNLLNATIYKLCTTVLKPNNPHPLSTLIPTLAVVEMLQYCIATGYFCFPSNNPNAAGAAAARPSSSEVELHITLAAISSMVVVLIFEEIGVVVWGFLFGLMGIFLVGVVCCAVVVGRMVDGSDEEWEDGGWIILIGTVEDEGVGLF